MFRSSLGMPAAQSVEAPGCAFQEKKGAVQGGQCEGVPEKGLHWISDNHSKSCYHLLNICYSLAIILSIINRLFHLLFVRLV